MSEVIRRSARTAALSHHEPVGGTQAAPSLVVTRIRPSHGWAPLNLRDLWAYRELLYFLTWRDVKVRYKQTVLGAAWAVLQPFLTMVVFSIFFGQLAKVPSDGVPYPIFSYAALLPWTFFAYALGQSSNSLVGGASLVSKVYFPRLIIPVASVLSGVVDFAIALVMMFALLIYYGAHPTPAVVFLPAFFLLAMTTALGVGLWLSALNVEYRDVRYVVPFLTQLWLFATPVAYPSSLLQQPWRTIYAINPMVGVVEGFRWALLGSAMPGPMILVSTVAAISLLLSGAFYFRRLERTFADII
jgi:lipopolysaccharide transport system permease protein